MPKTSKNIKPSVFILENNSGKVFIVDKNGKKSSKAENIQISNENSSNSQITMDFIKSEAELEIDSILQAEEVEENEDEDFIEEYLDECFEDNEEIEEQDQDEEIIETSNNQIITEPEETVSDEKTSKTSKKKKHKAVQLTGKLACKYCEHVFLTKESQKAHDCEYLKCHPKNFICRICNKELSKKTFSNHLHETLDCQYCQKPFINPRNLKTHIKNMHSNEPFIAPQKTAAEIQQELDMQEVLYEEVEIESHVLKRKITRKYVKKNEPKERLECDVCGRIFSNHRSLQNHIDIHMNNYKYICDVCGEKYATSTGILKHACLNKKRKRPEVDYRLYDVRHCKYCGLIFENFEANQRHKCEYQFEEDPKSFKCRFCDGVMSKHSYNKHMARHLATDDDLTCEYCGKKLADKTSLAIHITTHTGDRPFKCSQEGCTQSFINKNLLNRHLRFHGIEIETFSCTICNKTVASKYHLKFHMKTHKSLVECQLCKKEFESREKLREHYQNDHEPYSCQYCSKKFALPRYLKMHEATHVQTNDKPFKCDYCNNKSFTKIALLMNHMLKLHSDDFEEWKKSNEMLFHMKPADVL